MNWYKNLPPFVQATIERMIRGGIAAVAAAYVAGNLILGTINVDTFHQVLGLFIGGAIASLLMALGVQGLTKKGPALTSAENLTATSSAKHKPVQGGWGDAGLILLVYIAIAVTLLLFRVRFGG